jgi:hypothetical protein
MYSGLRILRVVNSVQFVVALSQGVVVVDSRGAPATSASHAKVPDGARDA